MMLHELKNWKITSREIDSLDPFYKLVTSPDLIQVRANKPVPCFKVIVAGEDMLICFARGDVYITRDKLEPSGFVCAVYPD